MRRTDTLIVGGGPAGAAAALALARGGAKPVLVERCAGDRDVVCGGFLGWDSLALLRRLGLEPAALGARPIHRLRLAAGGRSVETALPHAAAGLSRRRLDWELLRLAEEAGATVLRGRTARALDEGRVRLDGDEEIAAEAVFLATGKHDLRGAARETGGRHAAVGLRAALPPSPALTRALAGTVELHLYDGGYAGLLIQEDEAANLCLTVSRERMAAAGTPEALVEELARESPLLAERLAGGVPAGWEAVAGVPYGWRAGSTSRGLYRLGDQAAVIASLAGDGIAVALASGIGAARCRLAGGSATTYQRGFARRTARPVRIAEALRHMAEHRIERQALMLLARSATLVGAATRWTRIG